MDFRLDEPQIELQETVRRFCAARFSLAQIAVRESIPVDRAAWREMANLGVFSLLVAEDQGGLGLGVVEAAIAFEQLGAHLAGGPILWSTLAASYCDAVARGERLIGGIEPPEAYQDTPLLVEHAGEIDSLLILRGDGIFVCTRSELGTIEPLAPLDPLSPVGRIKTLPRGTRVGDASQAARLRRVGTVLAAAMLLGIAQTALDCSRRYALDREQFGVSIGSFQAVQHLLADMYVRTALARSATYAAAAVLDDPGVGDPRPASAAAKLLAGDAALENTRTAIQVHGGAGFTWEALPNYLLKRAWVLEHAFGDTSAHALTLGAVIEEAAP